MKLFLAATLTENKQHLKQVGMVSEDGRFFYTEPTDNSTESKESWSKVDVVMVNPIHSEGAQAFQGFHLDCRGTMEDIQMNLAQWLAQFETIEWVGDCAMYEFTAFFNFLKQSSLEVLNQLSPIYYEVNQALMIRYDCGIKAAYELSRDLLCEYIGAKIPVSDQYPALYRAYRTKEVYDFLHDTDHNFY